MKFTNNIILPRSATLMFFLLPALSLALAYSLGSFPFLKISAFILGIYVFIYYLLSDPERKSISFGLAIFILGIIVIDLFMRFFFPGILYYRFHEKFSRTLPEFPSVSRYYPNIKYEKEEYGDLRAMSGNTKAEEKRRVSFITDSLGFRNEAPAGEYDIVILGDSFGVGVGTDQAKILSSVLEKKLNQKIYNASMPGSPWQEYANFYLSKDKIKIKEGGKILWLIFSGNDLDEKYDTTDIEALRTKSVLQSYFIKIRTWRRRSIVGQILSRLLNPSSNPVISENYQGQEILFFRDYYERSKRSVDQLENHENAEAFAKTITAMKDLAGKNKINLTIVLIPSKEEIYGWVLDRSPAPEKFSINFSVFLEKMAKDAGVNFLDAGHYLFDQSQVLIKRGSFLWWRDDTHLNEIGNEMVASFLFSSLSLIDFNP